ncbi:hypothetical protein PHISCL_07171 [Aspergillus sclerotialis]|uniref:Restriction of telomere capping protein 4 n=1 Tax=Aspergillus sclerotialis TaxID=2070753 RepID=A0A3A2ZU25_9EURO|nr:hypothetical protein PHISCL_07171 [Aspergillus sclerotialis]
MVQQAKVEASYASTRITRRSRTDGPPLSQVNGVKLQKNTREKEKPEPKPKVKPEPGTDDEPEGSTDEDEDVTNDISDDDLCDYRGDKGRTRPSGTSLQEKIEAGEAAEREREKMLRSSQRGYGGLRSHAKSRKRPIGPGDASSDEELFPSISQSSKRHKARTYGSKPAFNPPKSSMSESVEPMSIANSQNNTKVEDESTEEKEEGFKFPMEIDLGSPPPRAKSSSKIKSEHDVKHNGSSKTKPGAFPNDAISSSSLAPSSSKNEWLFETDGSSLSTPPSSCSSDFELELSRVDERLNSAEESKSKPAQSLCPVCNEEVDPQLLEAFLAKPRRRVRDQLQFCESHQRTTAENQWQEKGYPNIDWDNFEQRIQGHFADIEKLLVPDSPSYYHNVLVDTLKSGKAKNFRLTLAGDGLEKISCGYYGTRGSTVMLQALTRRFSQKIRRLAASDQIINKAGVVGYTQSVLVPELAMRLVKEDMNVSDDIARQIMRDSINVGELLNANPNDVVPVPEKEEETCLN